MLDLRNIELASFFKKIAIFLQCLKFILVFVRLQGSSFIGRPTAFCVNSGSQEQSMYRNFWQDFQLLKNLEDMSYNIKLRKIICYFGQGYTSEVPIFASKTS